VRTLGDPWRPPRPPPSDCVVMVPGTVSYYSRSRSGGVLKGAGDGEVGLLAGGGCARRGKRQRSDGATSPLAPPNRDSKLVTGRLRAPHAHC